MKYFKSKWRIVEIRQAPTPPITGEQEDIYKYYVEFRFLFTWERWATPFDSLSQAKAAIWQRIAANTGRVVYTCES